MRTQGDMIVLSKTAAMNLISDKLGFLNPSTQYILWYFDKEDDGYVPRVDLGALSDEIASKGLAAKMANVAKLSDDNLDKRAMIDEIHAVVRKHELW